LKLISKKFVKSFPAVILIIIAGLAWLVSDSRATQKYTVKQEMNSAQFFADDFYASLNKLEITSDCDKGFRAGITTHHSLASGLVDQFFRCIQRNTDPKTVILIGPNHYSGGSSGAITGQNDWQTPFGTLPASEEMINRLAGVSVEINDRVVENDHAIAFIVPYIKYYLPNTKIVPLLIRSSFTKNEVDGLITQISETIDEETIIIGSIDFSHYQNIAQGSINDAETKVIITERNLSDVYQNGDEHYDSAPGIYAILSFLKNNNIASTYELNHSSSSEFTPATQNVTTYFNWLFY